MFVSRELHWPGEKGKPRPTIFQVLVDQALADGVGEAQRAQHDVDVVVVADVALNDLSQQASIRITFVTKSFWAFRIVSSSAPWLIAEQMEYTSS